MTSIGLRFQHPAALVFSIILACGASLSTSAQDLRPEEPVESDFDLLVKAEAGLKLSESWPTPDACPARQAEKNLKVILARSPDTPLRFQIGADLKRIGEIIGRQNLAVATFYQMREHGLRGAEARLQQIIKDYPEFSQIDEVLFRLAKVSVQLEKNVESSTYLSKLICNYPASVYVVPAFEQLNQIGDWKPCDVDKRQDRQPNF